MILLSFDIEEFDMPFEYRKTIPFADQIAVSLKGTHIILDLLQKYKCRATFFSTVIFAQQVPEIIERIKNEGHELASHSYYHSQFEPGDLLKSRKELERLSNMQVRGFRMPRMMPVDSQQIIDAGYKYDSSVNPTWIPGRYNNLDSPRTLFKKSKLFYVPASVTPRLRIPLFWLSMHNFPIQLYLYFLKRTYKKDGYINIYFHPWEFTDLTLPGYGLPHFVSRNSGEKMIKRMGFLMDWIKKERHTCTTLGAFVAGYDES